MALRTTLSSQLPNLIARAPERSSTLSITSTHVHFPTDSLAFDSLAFKSLASDSHPLAAAKAITSDYPVFAATLAAKPFVTKALAADSPALSADSLAFASDSLASDPLASHLALDSGILASDSPFNSSAALSPNSTTKPILFRTNNSAFGFPSSKTSATTACRVFLSPKSDVLSLHPSRLPEHEYAVVCVSDQRDVKLISLALLHMGYYLISTGDTADYLLDAGFPLFNVDPIDLIHIVQGYYAFPDLRVVVAASNIRPIAFDPNYDMIDAALVNEKNTVVLGYKDYPKLIDYLAGGRKNVDILDAINFKSRLISLDAEVRNEDYGSRSEF